MSYGATYDYGPQVNFVHLSPMVSVTELPSSMSPEARAVCPAQYSLATPSIFNGLSSWDDSIFGSAYFLEVPEEMDGLTNGSDDTSFSISLSVWAAGNSDMEEPEFETGAIDCLFH
ncbi:hypothetical protein GYMLUDRAFT_39725 [Collybiopsis luxurians FD-317 M1]|nr:hypothetical protein GYMLUDRAFT_39725 [Collybiopsis luxurians FD-317 M1]